jgi:hypothetical protein
MVGFFGSEARKLAALVAELRTIQKANGSGYKSTTATAVATSLEKQVDAMVADILGLPVTTGASRTASLESDA